MCPCDISGYNLDAFLDGFVRDAFIHIFIIN